MTLRLATQPDAPAIEAFLAGHAETSMFLRSNLADHGIGDSDHPHASTYWIAGGDGISGVFGRSNAGYLMAQAPDASPAIWAAWIRALDGQLVRGLTGAEHQVQAALRAMRLRVGGFATNHAEPLYRLDLNRLAAPDAVLRRAVSGDGDLLAGWFADYLMETGLTSDRSRAAQEAEFRARDALDLKSAVRLPDLRGEAVAMASLNASVGDMVQVGGVFVPCAYRNRGLGRQVTAARLAEARAEGARTAILFANNPAAARAYEAIGFDCIGSYHVAVLKRPTRIEAMS
ncbi:MAG: GNAT family N-acetyltransferase [Marinibacterium sp.]